MTVSIPFDNSYARLPPQFYAPVLPTKVAAPRLIAVNRALAIELGMESDRLSAEVFSGNIVPDGAEPLAMAYAGHQFGHFVRQLGDGRAILLGEVVDRHGIRRDIQLKGAGPTPYARRGDGRAALGPVLREYLVSEAMAALGVPTTRTLAAVLTGEEVMRETPLPGAVLTRVATSHVRVGTFQYFAARGDTKGVQQLADYVIDRHFPEFRDEPRRYRLFLEAAVQRQATLITQWLHIGFIHGVMNTDNTSVIGETIDYGPCAFMDAFDPAKVFSAIDTYGRYAYGNQAGIAHWNLARLAECLLPLLSDDEHTALREAEDAIAAFPAAFESADQAGLRRKLGLASVEDGDPVLAQDLLDTMAAQHADFTVTFRGLCDAAASNPDDGVRWQFADPEAFDAWALRWRQRLSRESSDGNTRQAAMRRVNPVLIPRNHRIEAVIAAAVRDNDFAPFHAMVDALSDPYTDRPHNAPYRLPPRPEEAVVQTFCGT